MRVYTPDQLERLLVAAEEAGDETTCDEIMLALMLVTLEEEEAMRSGKYPLWMYTEPDVAA